MLKYLSFQSHIYRVTIHISTLRLKENCERDCLIDIEMCWLCDVQQLDEQGTKKILST